MTRTRAAAFIFMSKAFSLGLSLVAVRFYLQWLGQEAYGIFTYGGVIATYLTFADIGLPSAAIQYVTDAHARDKDRLALYYHRVQLTLQTGVAFFIAMIAILLQFVPSQWLQLDVEGGKTILAIMSLGSVLVTLNSAFTGIFVSRDLFQVIALRESLVTAVSAGAGLWAVWQFRTPVALAWVTAGGSLFTLVFNGLLTTKRFSWDAVRPLRSRPLEKKLISYALRGFVQRTAVQIFRTVDRLLMPRALSFTALTNYSIAYRIPDTILVTLVAALQPVQPHFTREAANGMEGFGTTVDRMSRIMLLVAICAMVIPAGFGFPILKLWLGHNAPENGEWVTLLIGLSLGLQIYYMALAFAAYAISKPEKLIWPTVIKCVVIGLLTIPFARAWGIAGVAGLNAAFDVLQFVPYTVYMHRACGLPFPLAPHAGKVALGIGIGFGVALIGFIITSDLLAHSPFVGLALMPIFSIAGCMLLVGLKLADVPDGVHRQWSRVKARFR